MFHGVGSGLCWQQKRGSGEMYASAPYHHSLPSYSYCQCGQYLTRTMGRGNASARRLLLRVCPNQVSGQLGDSKISLESGYNLRKESPSDIEIDGEKKEKRCSVNIRSTSDGLTISICSQDSGIPKDN